MSNKLLFLSVIVGIVIPNAVLAEQIVIQQAGSNAMAIANKNLAASSVDRSANPTSQKPK